MNLFAVSEELAEQLGTILNGRTTPMVPDGIQPPAGYVLSPESEPHQSYQNGLTKLTLSVTVAVAKVPVDVAWKALAGYMSDTGDTSVKACLESGTYTTFHTIIVKRVTTGDLTIGGAPYKGAQFELEITGSGA